MDVIYKVRILPLKNKELLNVWVEEAKIAVQAEWPGYGIWDGFEMDLRRERLEAQRH